MVEIPFHRILVNSGREGLEIVFPYMGKWYRMKWEDVPEKFKILYVARLKLMGVTLPSYLKQYERVQVNVEELNITLDLTKAEEVKEEVTMITTLE